MLEKGAFIIAKFSRPISADVACGSRRYGVFMNTVQIQETLRDVNEKGSVVDVELAPQPCVAIGTSLYLSIKSITVYGDSYKPEGSGSTPQPIIKGSKKRVRTSP